MLKCISARYTFTGAIFILLGDMLFFAAAQEAFAKLEMDKYDDDDEGKVRLGTRSGPHRARDCGETSVALALLAVMRGLAAQVGVVRLFGSGALTVFRDNKDDPYLTLPDSDEESEREDFVIRDTGDWPAEPIAVFPSPAACVTWV